MSDEMIPYRGRYVIRGWPDRVAAAQLEPELSIGGQSFARVRYGDEEEDWGADRGPCHDCTVIKGEFHVPGCDAERCPCCGGQVISCECPHDDQEDDPGATLN